MAGFPAPARQQDWFRHLLFAVGVVGDHAARYAKRICRLRQRQRMAQPPFEAGAHIAMPGRSEEHTSELQSLMRISYSVFCLKKQKDNNEHIALTNNINIT